MSAKSSQDPPKIEFPCSYPIKIIGHKVDDFEDSVLAAVELYTGPLDSVSYTHLTLPTILLL